MIGTLCQRNSKAPWGKWLLFDVGDLNEYRKRITDGPFNVAGDFATNSPGDWTQILANADAFLANPSGKRWSNLPTEPTTNASGANPLVDYEPTLNLNNPPNSLIVPMRDAGLVYAITGNTTYGDAVKDELYDFYRVQAGLDMSNITLYPYITEDWGDYDMGYAIGWLKLVQAYDFTKDLFSPSEQREMESFFYRAGDYFRNNVNWWLNDNLTDRDTGDFQNHHELVYQADENAINAKTHHGGNRVYIFQLFWNNRRINAVQTFLAIGLLINDSGLINDAKTYIDETFKYSIFPDCTFHELGSRTVDSSSGKETGYQYAAYHLGILCNMAWMLLNHGDPYVFQYSSSVGHMVTAGGPKTLWGCISVFIEMYRSRLNGSITPRYANGHDGESDYRFDGHESGQSPYIHHIWLLSANRYYKSSLLQQVCTFTHADTDGFPSTPRTIGGASPWYGGVLDMPATMFMHAGLKVGGL